MSRTQALFRLLVLLLVVDACAAPALTPGAAPTPLAPTLTPGSASTPPALTPGAALTALPPTPGPHLVSGFVKPARFFAGQPGATVQVTVTLGASSPAAAVTMLRLKEREGSTCFAEGEMAQAAWEPFVAEKSYALSVPPLPANQPYDPYNLGFVFFTVSVQYQDAQGNLSDVVCDSDRIGILPPAKSALPPAPSASPVSAARAIQYVMGSTQKVCQLVGETDREFNQPTLNQTESRFGLVGNDLGYSFEHNGKLFFLFGDSTPNATFNGRPNLLKDPPRLPDDNDAIAVSTDTKLGPCVKLDFIRYAGGAFKNPVVLNAQGQPAITLRTNEVPTAGISDGGKLFVLFMTGNDAYPPGPTKGHLGNSTRTVIGVSDDEANTFHYLYDFSKPPNARFINVAIAQGQDGYIYFWGSQGGSLTRKSPAYLSRKPIGSMDALNPIEYLNAFHSDGTPVFVPSEGDATPLFHDTLPGGSGAPQIADCMGELSVAWNPIVKRWVMLYNCLNHTPENPRGIYMRFAEQPWGPWSAPQTIFNPDRDKGYCYFMHRAVDAQNPTPCDNLSDAGRIGEWGGEYAPYMIARFTGGDVARGDSTLTYTLSTWNPYTEVIMQSTIRSTP